jgi:hypothetical protein
MRLEPQPYASHPRPPVGDLLLLLAVLSLTMAVQIRFIPFVIGPGFEAVSISRSLAERGAFADPFDAATGPTAHLPPLYPAILALLRIVTPGEQSFRIAVLVLTILLHVVHAFLVFAVAWDLFPKSSTRQIAFAIVLVLPLYQILPPWETIWLCCGVLYFWLGVRRRRVLAAGLFGGLLLLMNPSLLFVLTPIAVCEWRRPRPAIAFLCLALLVTSPWIVRNYRVFGKVFFIRDNLGMELDLYNNDCEAFGATGCAPHPLASEEERRKIRELGEVRYNAVRLERAVTWLRTHPAAALRLAAGRAAGFWFPLFKAPPHGWSIALVTLLSLWGLACLARDRHPALWPMLAIALVYPVLYYFIHFDLRFRMPVLSLSVLAAAYGLTHARPAKPPVLP